MPFGVHVKLWFYILMSNPEFKPGTAIAESLIDSTVAELITCPTITKAQALIRLAEETTSRRLTPGDAAKIVARLRLLDSKRVAALDQGAMPSCLIADIEQLVSTSDPGAANRLRQSAIQVASITFLVCTKGGCIMAGNKDALQDPFDCIEVKAGQKPVPNYLV